MKKLILITAGVALCCGSAMAKPALKNVALDATATSNSEFKQLPFYLASNVIDGDRSNKGHGPKYKSWGPELIDDPWIKLEWKEEVEIESILVFIRCDFPPYQPTEHDSWWKTGTLELSSGKKIPFELKKTADGQTINIPKQKVSWIKFTDLVPDEKKWCGFCEIEVMGRPVK